MATGRFVAAAAQMCATEDRSANLALCRSLAKDAADRGAALLVLPECFAFLGRREKDRLAVAEVVDPARPGPILEAVLDMASTHKMWVIAGGMPEILAEEADSPEITRTYNTAVVASPAGELTARYRKIHLFDVDIPGRAVLRESDTTAAGRDVVVAETSLGRVGLSICYDVRFPELYRQLVVERGAQMVVVPAAFTAHTGAAHWHVLLRARAIENQCFVIAAAQSGRHNDKRASYGHSMLIDPWGTVMAEQAEGAGVVTAEIDLEALEHRRSQMPCLEHQVLLR